MFKEKEQKKKKKKKEEKKTKKKHEVKELPAWVILCAVHLAIEGEDHSH